MNFWRFINVYVVFLGICLFFAFLGVKLLKRDMKDRLNQLISLFFLTTSLGLLINLIYATIIDPSLQDLVNFLNILTIFMMCVGVGFLLLSLVIINNPQETSTKFQVLFMLLISSISSILFFIPDGAEVKITTNNEQLFPVWSFTFSATILIILLSMIITSGYLSIKIIRKFKTPIMVKKMKYFILGMCCFYYMVIVVPISNYLNIPFLRQLLTYTYFIIIIGAVLVYYGIGLPVKESSDDSLTDLRSSINDALSLYNEQDINEK